MDICIIRGDFVQGVLGRYGFTARQRRKFPLLFYLIPGHWPGDSRLLHYRLLFTFNLHPLAYPLSTGSPAIYRHTHTHTKADSYRQTEIRAREVGDRAVTKLLDRRYVRWLPCIPTTPHILTTPRILITPHIRTDSNIQKMVNHYHYRYPSTVTTLRTGTATEVTTMTTNTTSTPGHPSPLRPIAYPLSPFNLHPLAYPFSFDSPAIHRHIHTHTKADSYRQTEIRAREVGDRAVTKLLDRRYARWLPRIPTAPHILTTPRILITPHIRTDSNIQKMVNHYHYRYPSTVTTLRTGTATEVTTMTTNTTSTPGHPSPLRPIAYPLSPFNLHLPAYPLSTDSPAIHRHIHTHTEADFHRQTEIKTRWLPRIPTTPHILTTLRIPAALRILAAPDIRERVNHYHYPSTVTVPTGTATEVTTLSTRTTPTTNQSLSIRPLAYPLTTDSPAIHRHTHTHTEADSHRQTEIKTRWLPRSLMALRILTTLPIHTDPDIHKMVNHYHYPSTVTLRTGPAAPDLDRVFANHASRRAAAPLDYFTPAGPVRSDRQYPLTAIGKHGKSGIERQPMTQAAEGHSPATSGIGLRQLTDQVYRLLERRIKTERERRGW